MNNELLHDFDSNQGFDKCERCGKILTNNESKILGKGRVCRCKDPVLPTKSPFIAEDLLAEIEQDLAQDSMKNSETYYYCERCGQPITENEYNSLGIGKCCMDKVGRLPKEKAEELNQLRPIEELWQDSNKTKAPFTQSINWVQNPLEFDYKKVDTKGKRLEGISFKRREDGRIVKRRYNPKKKRIEYYAYKNGSKKAENLLSDYNLQLAENKAARIEFYDQYVSKKKVRSQRMDEFGNPIDRTPKRFTPKFPKEESWNKWNVERRKKWFERQIDRWEAKNEISSRKIGLGGNEIMRSTELFDKNAQPDELWRDFNNQFTRYV